MEFLSGYERLYEVVGGSEVFWETLEGSERGRSYVGGPVARWPGSSGPGSGSGWSSPGTWRTRTAAHCP